MTISLRTIGFKPAGEGDAVDALLDCHERIRRFSAMAAKLATLPDGAPEGLADGAARLHRYFATSLPLHVDDEELSFAPRVEAIASPTLRATLDELSAEHAQVEEIVSRLLPGWRALIERRGEPARVVASIERDSLALEPLLLAHLKVEEEVVFPELRRLLTPGQHAEVKAEMSARRAVV